MHALLLLLACSPEPPAPPTPRPARPILGPRPDPAPVHVAWSLDTTEVTGDNGSVRRPEWLGRVAVALEAQLYRAVVPIGPAGRPPAVEQTPVAEPYQLVLLPHDDGRVEASVCSPDGTCEIHFAAGEPEAIGVALAQAAMDQLGLPPRSVPDCLTGPPSADDYATLMTGRSAAIVYGLYPPSEHPDDPRLDPVARAVFLDPAAATAQWLAGRTAWKALDPDGAAEHLHFATRRCLEHEGFAADDAIAWALLGARRGAFPDDDRFLFARLDAGLQRAEPETYAAAIAAIDRWPDDARLERRAADAAPESAVESHLARWAELDPTNPIPVRRLARRSLDAREWRRLLDLCDELERRGVDVSRWRTPALLALERIDAASRSAPPAVRDRVAARAGEPTVGDSPEELLLGATRIVDADPEGALERCQRVLEVRPYWPEALAVASRAARAAGRRDPYAARLAQAEP